MPLLYTLGISDADGDVFPINLYVNAAVMDTMIKQDAAAFQLWDYLGIVMTGKLEYITISRDVDISTFSNVGRPLVTSDIQEKLILDAEYQGIGKRHKGTITLPTLTESYLTGSGANKVLNIANPNVALLVGSLPLPLFALVNRHNEDLVLVPGGKQSFG